jgi:hypothetical protein
MSHRPRRRKAGAAERRHRRHQRAGASVLGAEPTARADIPRNRNADAKRTRRSRGAHPTYLQETPIAVLIVLKGLRWERALDGNCLAVPPPLVLTRGRSVVVRRETLPPFALVSWRHPSGQAGGCTGSILIARHLFDYVPYTC